jgi:hypothetical protein
MHSKPKRHHWWPIAQSRHWTDAAGLVFVTRADGTTFKASPLNIGVEAELYTRFDEDTKNTQIEDWFAETIDGPATLMIQHLLDPRNVRRTQFTPNPTKAEVAKKLGYRVNSYVVKLKLPMEIRAAIARYVAALLVRHPSYIKKLIVFHGSAKLQARDRALDNMLELYKAYAERIIAAAFIVSRRVGHAEYLYADGGLVVTEPWRTAFEIPFDIHAPITPDFALEILPVPTGVDLSTAMIAESTTQGVARQNRIILGGAQRFVFSRQSPPVRFIQKHFGKPAPESIGYRMVGGRLEAFYDPSRDV